MEATPFSHAPPVPSPIYDGLESMRLNQYEENQTSVKLWWHPQTSRRVLAPALAPANLVERLHLYSLSYMADVRET